MGLGPSSPDFGAVEHLARNLRNEDDQNSVIRARIAVYEQDLVSAEVGVLDKWLALAI